MMKDRTEDIEFAMTHDISRELTDLQPFSDIRKLELRVMELSAPKAEIRCVHVWNKFSFLPKGIRWCDKCKTWDESTPKKKGAK